MNEYDEQLMRYEEDAEDHFDNYHSDAIEVYDDDSFGADGIDEDSYDDYDEDYEMEEFDDYVDTWEAEDYDEYRRSTIGRIDPNDRTLTVVITNKSGAQATAIVFGGNADKAQPTGVTVDIEESSHKEVREESKSNPFKIWGMKYSVSNALQFDNVLSIERRTASGTKTTRVYQPRNATSPQNFSQTLIDDDNFQMDVTGQDSLLLAIEDGVTAVFTFTIKARANIGNVLRGSNIAERSSAPRTTGLPQLDLLRRRRVSGGRLFARPPRRPRPRRRNVMQRRKPINRRNYRLRKRK